MFHASKFFIAIALLSILLLMVSCKSEQQPEVDGTSPNTQNVTTTIPDSDATQLVEAESKGPGLTVGDPDETSDDLDWNTPSNTETESDASGGTLVDTETTPIGSESEPSVTEATPAESAPEPSETETIPVDTELETSAPAETETETTTGAGLQEETDGSNEFGDFIIAK